VPRFVVRACSPTRSVRPYRRGATAFIGERPPARYWSSVDGQVANDLATRIRSVPSIRIVFVRPYGRRRLDRLSPPVHLLPTFGQLLAKAVTLGEARRRCRPPPVSTYWNQPARSRLVHQKRRHGACCKFWFPLSPGHSRGSPRRQHLPASYPHTGNRSHDRCKSIRNATTRRFSCRNSDLQPGLSQDMRDNTSFT
jgi:hypothetical protein